MFPFHIATYIKYHMMYLFFSFVPRNVQECVWTLYLCSLKPSFRLLCAFEGKYLVQEMTQVLVERDGEHDGTECLSFSCSLPNAVGRGFIEVPIYHRSPLSLNVTIHFLPLLNVSGLVGSG